MSAFRPSSTWVKRGIPKPANFDELWQAAAARQAAARRHDQAGQATAAAAFAHEFAVLAADTRAAGYPPPTLVGWLDEETGEVR